MPYKVFEGPSQVALKDDERVEPDEESVADDCASESLDESGYRRWEFVEEPEEGTYAKGGNEEQKNGKETLCECEGEEGEDERQEEDEAYHAQSEQEVAEGEEEGEEGPGIEKDVQKREGEQEG